MKKLAVTREHTANRQLDRIQEQQRAFLRKVQTCPFVFGVLRSVTFVAGTEKRVQHGMGVKAAAILIRQNYDGTGTRAKLAEASTAFQTALDLTNELGLVADVNCTVDVWLYPRMSEATPR